MIKGLYRTQDVLLGACVRVDWSAGDAAPLLTEDIYRIMGGTPKLEDLMSRGDYLRSGRHCEAVPLELA